MEGKNVTKELFYFYHRDGSCFLFNYLIFLEKPSKDKVYMCLLLAILFKVL